MNVIEIQELTKVYKSGMKRGDVIALDGVSLDIEQGEIFGLLGPNGAGKTTLFKSTLGIISITSGSVLLNGLPPSNPESRAKVGYLPENHRFPLHLTGMGLLDFTGRMYGLEQGEIDKKADELLDLVGMSKWQNYRIAKYSKGMAQRIGLAQALISDPDVLFLDEPTDGVDPVGKIEIREILIKVRNQGKTIILNSHLLSEVESAADRVAILQKGKVARLGTVASLTSRQSQYEIIADIGTRLIDIPEEIGRKLAVTATKLIVELKKEEMVNAVIDQMRRKDIMIRSIQPLRVSLEQSFIETIANQPGEEAQQ